MEWKPQPEAAPTPIAGSVSLPASWMSGTGCITPSSPQSLPLPFSNLLLPWMRPWSQERYPVWFPAGGQQCDSAALPSLPRALLSQECGWCTKPAGH